MTAKPSPDGKPAEPRRRDSARTRQQLLDVARRRFARDGYAATTVRDVTDEAGVNVALVNRYFGSKEGLFEACLTTAVEELRHSNGNLSGLSEVPAAIAGHAVGVTGEERPNPVLLLLLRSSGDERTEQMRLGVLRTFGERLAATAGWRPDAADADRLILRAQFVLAASIGMVVLRSAGLEPLASAAEAELTPPLNDLVEALLARSDRSTVH